MYSNRTKQIKPFRVMEVLARAGELERDGHQVVHFEVGEPDFPTAEPIVSAGKKALEQGVTKYTSATGTEQLRQTIANFYQQQNIKVLPEQILVTNGASGGLTLLAALLINPGDKLLITDPGYPCNEVFVHLVGGEPKPVPVRAANRFQPSLADLASAWDDRTVGALLASPANPTGTMLGAIALGAIADWVNEKPGYLILDEIYQGLALDAEYSSGLAISDGMFVLNSFSKLFGMTGWRLGWLVLPEESIEASTKLAQNLFICPNAIAQEAAVEAFSPAAMTIHRERAEMFSQRCRLLYDGLLRLGFTIPVYPDGAFYLYVDVSHTGLTGREFCWRLLNDFHVAVTPGDDFGMNNSEQFVRFAFTTSFTQINYGLERIERALLAWDVA